MMHSGITLHVLSLQKKDTALLSCFFLLTVLLATFSINVMAIKCWVNHEGITECGNKIPPEFAQQEYEKLNKSGGREVVRRAPTPEELDAMDKKKRQQKLEEKKRQERKQKDEFLLNTYHSMADLEKAREDKLKFLQSDINLINIQVDKLQKRLDKNVARVAVLEEQGREISPEQYEDIESIRSQIEKSIEVIKLKELQRKEIEKEFIAFIERYKILKSEN